MASALRDGPDFMRTPNMDMEMELIGRQTIRKENVAPRVSRTQSAPSSQGKGT